MGCLFATVGSAQSDQEADSPVSEGPQFSGKFGEECDSINADGIFDCIYFKTDGTFGRTYEKWARGSDYKDDEPSGGVSVSVSGTYTRDGNTLNCKVLERTDLICMHDWMLSDIGKIKLEFEEGYEFSAVINDEGVSFNDTLYKKIEKADPPVNKSTQFSGKFGEECIEINAVGTFDCIYFNADGTFERTYSKRARGRDYKEHERSGGVSVAASGTYIRDGKTLNCKVVERTNLRCMHDFMLSDIGNTRLEFVAGYEFSAIISQEGVSFNDTLYKKNESS